MKPLTLTQATDGQLKQIKRVATDAAEKAIEEFGLDKDGAQRVHARGNELAEAIHTAVIASLEDLSASGKFKDEEVPSKYGYLSGYRPEGQDLDCQIMIIQNLFPGLGGANQDYLQRVNSGEIKVQKPAEKFFAIPNIWKQGGLPVIFGTTYSEALLRVLDLLKQTRDGKFKNYCEGQLDEKRLHQSEHTQKFFRDISEAQGSPDILIVPAQFGIRHCGRSVRRAREVSLTNEFGLGAFAVGIMILTHPERLQHCDDLWVDCAGDEFDDSDLDVRFDNAFFFGFDRVGVRFGMRFVGSTIASFGSPSGFVPQK